MDEQRQRRLEDIPDCSWEFWKSRTKEDISRMERWGSFIVWFETSSRYVRGAVVFLMAGFGFYQAAATLWAKWVGKG